MRGRAPTSALVGQGWGRQGDASSAMATVRPATTKGSGWRAVRGKDLTVARPGTAPWRLAQRRRDETKGRWGPGGRTESDRGRQKGGVASPSGNRTPVSRVTGGDTHHYTNENVGDRPTALPLSGCLSMPPPAQHPAPRVLTQPRTQPTAWVTAAAPTPAGHRSVVGKVSQSPVLFR